MKQKNLFYLFAVLFLVAACNDINDSVIVENQDSELTASPDNNGVIKIGQKFENAYSVKNMKAAYREMQAQTRAGEGEDSENIEVIEIGVTDLYSSFPSERFYGYTCSI
ncbi:MAG: hypothetical protein LBS52_03750 [Dysgonamonadaceae bacterium]|jgi:hypothetical protein|nr:hypothetical protein [Dysgonamonadaceae bacterium]